MENCANDSTNTLQMSYKNKLKRQSFCCNLGDPLVYVPVFALPQVRPFKSFTNDMSHDNYD